MMGISALYEHLRHNASSLWVRKHLSWMLNDEPDYEHWALTMCGLLDKIELSSDDEIEVHRLCQMRFQIARDHGLTVEFSGVPMSGRIDN